MSASGVRLLHLFFSQHPASTSRFTGVFVGDSQGTTGGYVREVMAFVGSDGL